MTSAYKWRITGSKFAYLTTPSGGDPFIGSYTVDDEEKIATLVNTTFSGETAYAAQYEKVKAAVAADPDGKNITMLSYKYYYNIDDANCGFSQEAIGPQGEQGIQGIQGIQGEKGDEGNGIKEVVVSSITDTVQRIIISFTDGRPNVYFDVQNGMNGIAAEIDYNRILSGITYLDISGQTLSGLSEYVLEQLKGLYDSKIDSINDELADAKSTLEQLTGNVGGIDNQVNTLSGITVDIYNYYDKELSAVTIIQNTVNAVSGMVSNDMEYIDVLNSAVTELGRGMLAVSGLVYDYVYRTDELEHAMTGYTESFNALYGEYVRTVSQLTHSGDTEVVTLSQIRQRADTISAFTENSSGLSAGLIIAINEQENIGEVKIKADKITMDGDLIAQAITGTSLTIGSGVSHLNGDGSGSLANNSIHWNDAGYLTLENGSYINNCSIKNCDIENVSIENATLKDVVIEGILKQPWVETGSYIGGYAKAVNYAYMNSSDHTTTLQSERILSWDKTDNGRTINIGNFGNSISTSWGTLTIQVPEGLAYRFYEDGMAKTFIKMSREMTTLIGLGYGDSFLGYIVANRIDVQTENVYGRKAKSLFTCYRTPTGTFDYRTFDNSTGMSCTKVSDGLFKVIMPVAWSGRLSGPIIPYVCGEGSVDDKPVVASIQKVDGGTERAIYVYTMVGGELKDGGFILFANNFIDFATYA